MKENVAPCICTGVLISPITKDVIGFKIRVVKSGKEGRYRERDVKKWIESGRIKVPNLKVGADGYLEVINRVPTEMVNISGRTADTIGDDPTIDDIPFLFET